MKKIAIMVANKSEEMEIIIPADLWRRAGLDVQIISVEKKKNIVLQHGVRISCDDNLIKENLSKYNAIYLPGGKGHINFLDEACDKLKSHLTKMAANINLHIFAVCAAPKVLNELKLIENIQVTIYPGLEQEVAHYVDQDVVIDKNFITAKGPGVMIDFALTVIEKLASRQIAEKVASQILYKYWK